MRSFRMLGFIALFALLAATPQIGRWVSTASASAGATPSAREAARASANDNDEDLCNSDNPRKQKKCHYNQPNVDNDNDGSGDRPPVLTISVSNADPKAGDAFTLTLHAWGREIDQVWWWVPNVFDDNGNDNDSDSFLADAHVLSCNGDDDCTVSSDLTTRHTGTVTIYAKARDRQGRESGEVAAEVRVRHP